MDNREIERKFLVTSLDFICEASSSVRMVQAYLIRDSERVLRVRTAGDRHILTLKVKDGGAGSFEWEKELTADDAEVLMAQALPGVIEKVRYYVPYDGMTWEVDVFSGCNSGLAVAEIELDYEGQHVNLPPWAGAEVTSDPAYLNCNLAERPFETWKDSVSI